MVVERIEDAKNFEEIDEIRDGWIREYIRNGDDLQSLLTDLYKEPSHFIYELIQNAEDAWAAEVNIDLQSGRLTFSHNGGRPFDINDIRSITGIGDIIKKPEDNKIGRFGIGFKSVFGICETPQIYCKNYCFEIHNLRVPRKIERQADFEKGTHFVLPFKNKERIIQDIYLSLYKAIEELNSDTILFLRNIKTISWTSPNIRGSFKEHIKAKTCGEHTYYECEIKNGAESVPKYLVFKKALSTNDKLFVSIAYKIKYEKDKRIIGMEDTTTNFVAFFRFKVNGPYAMANTRACLNNKRKDENDAILAETIEVYEDNLYCIKELGLFYLAFFGLLPINSSILYQNEHSKVFYETTLKVMKASEFLPTAKGGLTKPSDAILVGSKELSELLSDEADARAVFGRGQWLDVSITQTNSATRTIYDYIKSTLGVPDQDVTLFVNAVKDKFIADKANEGDDWLLAFYTLINGNKAIKSKLEKKIILLDNGQMVDSFTGDVPNAFLPSKTKSKKTIKASLCESKGSVEFFKYIGLGSADVVEEVRDFITELKNSKDTDDLRMHLPCSVIAQILEASKDGADTVVQTVSTYNAILFDRVIPYIFKALFDVVCHTEMVEKEVALLQLPEGKEFYEFNAEPDKVVAAAQEQFNARNDGGKRVLRDKSFHADTYCFDSTPELKCFWDYIKSEKDREVHFTGMFTSKYNGLRIQYIAPETHTVRSYYPDFITFRDDETIEIIEVKGDHELATPIVQAKADAAAEMAVESKMRYRMLGSTSIMKSKAAI